MLKQTIFGRLCLKILTSLVPRPKGPVNAPYRQYAHQLAASPVRVHFLECAVDGGPLDYAGRIYCVEGQECLVRLFSYKEPSGKAHIVVRPDGYQRILIRQDNDLSHMKLDPRLDSRIKEALRSYIARSFCTDGGDVVLKLG